VTMRSDTPTQGLVANSSKCPGAGQTSKPKKLMLSLAGILGLAMAALVVQHGSTGVAEYYFAQDPHTPANFGWDERSEAPSTIPSFSGLRGESLLTRDFGGPAPLLSVQSENQERSTFASPSQGCAGRCWNPHPGQFRSWYGQQNGCFVQVWRQWQDGCTHWQLFNSCSNYYDPNINWTCCVH
jgi:hypothetical protein